jgi:hypothetical protein
MVIIQVVKKLFFMESEGSDLLRDHILKWLLHLNIIWHHCYLVLPSDLVLFTLELCTNYDAPQSL